MSAPRSKARLALGALVLCAAILALLAIFRTAASAPAVAAFTSSQQCQQCHATQYAEWSASWHARAWSDPDVRELSNDFQNADCIDCHAPRPVFETGIGQRVLPRSSRRAEGVDCISCHELSAGHVSGGLVAGTRDDPEAECRPAAVRDLGSSAFCAVCHDQHDTYKQWQATDYAARGIGCIDCHMKSREGAPASGHVMAGGHDIDLVRRAVALRGRREAQRWLVEVENVGAGHHVPTEERSRALDVFWRPLEAATGAAPRWRHAHRFRQPYRHEGLPDTLLPAHATHAIALDEPAASGAIEVALFYSLRPYWADPEHPDPEREARLVQRIELWP